MISNDALSSFSDVFAINANARILDLASQSVKVRRRRGKSFEEEREIQHKRKEAIRLSDRAPSPSPSRRLFDKSLPLLPTKRVPLHKTTFPANMNSQSSRMGQDTELINTRHQQGIKQVSIPSNGDSSNPMKSRRQRSKALGHALRKSKDLRNARELAEMIGRPLPPLPPVEIKEELKCALVDSPLELQGPPVRPKRCSRRLNSSKYLTVTPNKEDGQISEDEDWADFISRGYSLFPKPPSTKPVFARSNRLRNSYRNSKRMSISGLTKLDTIPQSSSLQVLSPQSSVDEPYMTPSLRRRKDARQKTGIDWLDDELAWVSSDDEREELCKATTPPEASFSTFKAGLGLSNTVSTPPSSSVETFPDSISTSSTFRSPTTQRLQQANWRLSGMSDVFVTPTASPQIDLGPVSVGKPNRVDGKTLSSVKRAHLPMFAGLADAVSRYAAEAAGFDEGHREHYEEARGEQVHASKTATKPIEGDAVSFIVANRHDSVSTIYSSSAMSRDFSSATTVSTRPSSVAGNSECGSSASWARSPTSQARMRTLPAGSTSSRVGSMDGSQAGMDVTASPSGTFEKLNRSNSTSRHDRRISDTNSSTRSIKSRRKHSSRIQFPQEGSLPPPTPMRVASLQLGQSLQEQAAAAVASARPVERPLLGSWLANDETFEPMQVKEEKSVYNPSTSTIVLDKYNENVLRSHIVSNQSNVDLTQTSTQTENVSPKTGFKSLFGRQRRQSTSVMLDSRGPLNKNPVPAVTVNGGTSASMERSRSSTHLADRLLSRMGGGAPANAFDLARPMADVPVTPTTTEDSSPSMKIFGSASLASVAGSKDQLPSYDGQRSSRSSHFPSIGLFSSSSADLLSEKESRMTAADGLRAFAEASSASKRTSTISTKAMPSNLSSGTSALSVQRNGNQTPFGGSLTRAKSLRSRVRGLVFDYDPSSPFYVYEDDNQIPVNTSSRFSTDIPNAEIGKPQPVSRPKREGNGKAAPPVTFWRRGGARVLSVTEPSFEQIQSDQVNPADLSTPTNDNVPPFQRTIRRKSSFTLWK